MVGKQRRELLDFVLKGAKGAGVLFMRHQGPTPLSSRHMDQAPQVSLWWVIVLTCSQGGQNQSPSGTIISGGRRHAVW